MITETETEIEEDGVNFSECLPVALTVQPESMPAIAPRIETPKQMADTLSGYIHRAEVSRDGDISGDVFRLGVCRHCGVSLGGRDEDKVILISAFGFLPNVCCQSCSDAGKERMKLEADQDRTKSLSGIIPTEFFEWNLSLGNNAALARARGKFSLKDRRGLILHGPSGSCKTRIMWEIVKQIATDISAPTWAVLDAYEISTTGIPKDALFSHVLFIDDLGNEPKNQKFEHGLLHLFRRRHDWHRPIVITTQLSSTEFQQRFFAGSASAAIWRRVSERCGNVSTANLTLYDKA